MPGVRPKRARPPCLTSAGRQGSPLCSLISSHLFATGVPVTADTIIVPARVETTVSHSGHSRRRRLATAKEEEVQDEDPIGQLHSAVVIGIGCIKTGRRPTTEEEEVQDEDPIGQLDCAVVIGISAVEHRTSHDLAFFLSFAIGIIAVGRPVTIIIQTITADLLGWTHPVEIL